MALSRIAQTWLSEKLREFFQKWGCNPRDFVIYLTISNRASQNYEKTFPLPSGEKGDGETRFKTIESKKTPSPLPSPRRGDREE